MRIFYNLISPEIYHWILVGSTSLYFQGVKILLKPDIDIIFSKKDIYKADRLINNYNTKTLEFSENKMYRSYYGKYNINNINFDLMAEFQYKKRDGNWSEIVDLNKYNVIIIKEMKLKVLPLEKELVEYYETKRLDKYKKILNFLESTN